MLSRRELLITTATAGAAALLHPVTRAFAAAAQPSTPVNFEVPKEACDCHVHVFGEPARFPFFTGRAYTPEPAGVDELRRLHRALHIERVVIVQASVYGTDNSCTLDAMKHYGSQARGISVIDDQTSKAALDDMDRSGIRGVRINLGVAGGPTNPTIARQRLQAAFRKIEGRNWHVQMFVQLSVIAAIKEQVMASPVPIVFDHFGGAMAALGVEQPGFEDLLTMLQSGKAYVKISAPYRIGTPPDFADAKPLAKALIAANPQRILWGTDWPHPDTGSGRKPTEVSPLSQVDDGRVFNQLPIWAPGAALRKTILVDNPARLYGF